MVKTEWSGIVKGINRKALKISLIFMMLFIIFNIIASLFMVTWGSTNAFKESMLFLLSFPIDWANLMEGSFVLYFFLYALFWALIVYVLSTVIISLTSRYSKP